jgi:hypothetical protein
MKAQLDSDFIPKEILTDVQRFQKVTAKWLDEYVNEVAISPSDFPHQTVMTKDIGAHQARGMIFQVGR